MKVKDAISQGGGGLPPGWHTVEIDGEPIATTAKTGTLQVEVKFKNADGHMTTYFNKANDRAFSRWVHLVHCVTSKPLGEDDDVEWDRETRETGEDVAAFVNSTPVHLGGRKLDIQVVKPPDRQYSEVAGWGFARAGTKAPPEAPF